MNDRELDTLRAGIADGSTPMGRWRRRRAVRRLARRGTPAATRVLAEVVVANPPGAEVFQIADRALAGLRDQAAIEVVCDVFVATGDGLLDSLVRRQGWLPSDPARRALVLFLQGEFDRYAELDFDGSLLAAAHAAADEGLRTRLATCAREAGRVEWVRAVVGRRTRRLGELSDSEWEATIGALGAAERWEQLWRLARQAPPMWSARMLRVVGEHKWRPADQEDRAACEELLALGGACADGLPPGSVFEELIVLKGRHIFALSDLVVSPDGALLASSTIDGAVRLWQLPSGSPVGILKPPADTDDPGRRYTQSVGCLAITPDSRLLAAGGGDGTVRLWRLPSGDPVGALHGHTRAVSSLAVTPDGGLLASGCRGGGWATKPSDTAVRLWRLPSGEPVGTLKGHNAGIDSLVVTPNGALLASCSGAYVRLWRLPSGRRAGTRKLTDNPFGYGSSLAVTPDDRLLVAAGPYGGGTVQLWRLPAGMPAGTLYAGPGMVDCLAVSPDGRFLVNGGAGGVGLRRLPSGETVGTLADDVDGTAEAGVRWLAVTPDGRLLVGQGADRIRLWRLPSGAPAGTLPISASKLLTTPDGALLAGINPSGEVQLWRWRGTPSRLESVVRRPVAEIDPVEVERLKRSAGDAGARALVGLTTALVRWHHMRDIELAEESLTNPPGTADIELDADPTTSTTS